MRHVYSVYGRDFRRLIRKELRLKEVGKRGFIDSSSMNNDRFHRI